MVLTASIELFLLEEMQQLQVCWNAQLQKNAMKIGNMFIFHVFRVQYVFQSISNKHCNVPSQLNAVWYPPPPQTLCSPPKWPVAVCQFGASGS